MVRTLQTKLGLHSKVGGVVRESGLYVMEGRPYIGASPDGLVECECCPKRVLEVKCPKTMKKLVQENMEKTKENVPGQKLRHTMTFFYQVQMQMNLTGVRHSVFVYISADDNLHIKVEFDEDYFQDVVERASCFFQKAKLNDDVMSFSSRCWLNGVHVITVTRMR
ncbi:hypothetical protein HPB47_019563 [Ixodes persulcatus]|uniref:Uncharacterized protein n=1 Tax=Ixodes persulcatus TaxID=34615 RepID=A0AC60QHT3_IXOPE|nr:hypothetical protein HPB47_019563 [Ixodes persulcatus]